jgi:hypothetical protein
MRNMSDALPRDHCSWGRHNSMCARHLGVHSSAPDKHNSSDGRRPICNYSSCSFGLSLKYRARHEGHYKQRARCFTNESGGDVSEGHITVSCADGLRRGSCALLGACGNSPILFLSSVAFPLSHLPPSKSIHSLAASRNAGIAFNFWNIIAGGNGGGQWFIPVYSALAIKKIENVAPLGARDSGHLSEIRDNTATSKGVAPACRPSENPLDHFFSG